MTTFASPKRSTILKQIGALLVSGATGRAAMLVANILMIRVLPVEQNGTLQLGLGIGTVAAVACEIGSRGYLLRELSCLHDAPERAQRLLAEVMGLRYWITLVTLGVLALLVAVFQPSAMVLLATGLMVAYAWLDSLSMQWKAVLRAYDRVSLDALLTVAGRGVVLATLAVLHANGQLTMVSAAVGFVSGAVLEAVLACVAISVRTPLRPLRGSDWSGAMFAARRTAAFGVANVCATLNARQGTLLLGGFVGERSAGYLATAQKLPEAMAFVPVAIMNAMIPHLSRLAGASQMEGGAASGEVAARRCGELLAVCGAGAAVLGVIMVCCPVALMSMLGWQAYEPAATAFRLCGVWTVLNSWNYVTANMLLSLRDDAWVRRRYAMATATIFAVNLALVPFFGFVGAAVALVVGETLQTGLDYRRLRTLGVPPQRRSYFGAVLVMALGAGAWLGVMSWLGPLGAMMQLLTVTGGAGVGAAIAGVPMLRRLRG